MYDLTIQEGVLLYVGIILCAPMLFDRYDRGWAKLLQFSLAFVLFFGGANLIWSATDKRSGTEGRTVAIATDQRSDGPVFIAAPKRETIETPAEQAPPAPEPQKTAQATPRVSSGLPGSGTGARVVFRGSSLPTGGPIRLKKGRSGHFEAELTLNNHPVRFLVDTGASQVSLSRRTAQTIGLRPDTLRYSVPFRTANGITHAARAEVDSIAFGSVTERGFPVFVSEHDNTSNLLGMSYLSRFSNISIDGDVMILTR